MTSLSDTSRLQYYDVQTLEYRYISKLPMTNERIWSYVKETTSHLQEHTSRGRHKVFNKVGLFKTNMYYNCVKLYLNPMSRLEGVALTSPSLHTERISEYKLNYLPFQILDSNHIPSCTSEGSVLQLCKVS